MSVFIYLFVFRPVRSSKRHERRPVNSETLVYQFNGLPSKKMSRRKYISQNIKGQGASFKVVLADAAGLKKSERTPFQYCLKETWSLAEIQARHPDGLLIGKRGKIESTPLGAFIIHKNVIWRKSLDSTSEKITCYFQRLDCSVENNLVHKEANNLIETIKSCAEKNKLQGMCIYKNILTGNRDNMYKDLMVEFLVKSKSGKKFIPDLEKFANNVEGVGFTYGIFKRYQVIDDEEFVSNV